MGKLLWHTMMTLDGFTAGANDDMSWAFGQDAGSGANIARQCLENGLLDEIVVHVAPVLVGDGVRLFERVGGEPVKLDPISSVDEGGMTVLRYSVGRASAS